jgi:glycosyltransferase involved in cell wall biosynthesis
MSVSVILPCYNCGPYIGESIQSILDQTYTDFELIVIDDGSTDETLSVIQSFNDRRIRLANNDQNIGLVAGLNKGLNLAQYEYIAIMHGDDIALPNRLAEQVDYLQTHPEVVCCGSWINILGTNQTIAYPTHPDEVHVRMLQENVIAHPTVMFRSATIRTHNLSYHPEYHYGAEDYAFWQQFMLVGKMANIPKVLLKYRVHNNQKSELYKQRIIGYTQNIRTHFLTALCPSGRYEQFLGNYPNASDKSFSYPQFDQEIQQLRCLIKQNALQKTYNPKIFNNYIRQKEFYLTRAFVMHHLTIPIFFNVVFGHPGSLIRTLFRKISFMNP